MTREELDDGLVRKLRSALRFAASHSVLTSAEEQAILASLDTEAVKAEREACAQVAEAEMAKRNLYVERKLGGDLGIERNTACYQAARGIAASIRNRSTDHEG